MEKSSISRKEMGATKLKKGSRMGANPLTIGAKECLYTFIICSKYDNSEGTAGYWNYKH